MTNTNDYQPRAEHKFSFGLWTVGNRGRDAFGDAVRPSISPNDLVSMLAEVGAWGVNLHDNDLVPIDATAADRAEMAPIIGAGFKMMVPFIVVLPGLLGLAVLPEKLLPESVAAATGGHSYNDVLPLMLARYCGPGLLGLGVTALIAGFMSGMAGNVSAFTTVWTYDIYRPFINRKGSDHHYVNMGRWTTIIGVLISVGTAYLVMQFASIMDYVQALFSFFIAPLFGTVVLGMLWKRATGPGGFWGLLCGTFSSIAMWTWVKIDPLALRYVAMSPHAKGLAQDMYQALWSFVVCVTVTVVVSLATKPMPSSQLAGLVYGLTAVPSVGDVPLYKKPLFWAAIVFSVFLLLQIVFW